MIKHRVADEVTPSQVRAGGGECPVVRARALTTAPPSPVGAPQKGGSTQRIMHRMNSTFVFHVNFPKPVIRREH